MVLLVRKYKLPLLNILCILYLISIVDIKITKRKTKLLKLYNKHCFKLTSGFGFTRGLIVVILCRNR